MAKLPSGQPRIFFPWERAGGLGFWLRLGRVRPIVVGLSILGFVMVVAVRERRRAGVRQTQATLLDVRRAVDAYLADHDGGCPPALSATSPDSRATPVDAWGRPLRLVCPSRTGGETYELMSDGPDGQPGGLDRIQ